MNKPEMNVPAEEWVEVRTQVRSIAADLSELKKLLERVIRIEERESAKEEALSKLSASVTDLARRVAALERHGAGAQAKAGIWERFFWIVVAMLIGVVGYQIKT